MASMLEVRRLASVTRSVFLPLIILLGFFIFAFHEQIFSAVSKTVDHVGRSAEYLGKLASSPK